MEIKKIGFIFSLFMLICLVEVDAIGISPASITLNFESNLVNTYTFYAHNNKEETIFITPTIYGDLEKYIKLVNNSPKLVKPGESAEFQILINLPSAINIPGISRSYLSVSESAPDGLNGNALYSISSVSASIDVKVPYPGKYAIISLITPNVDVGEIAEFKINVENVGEQYISKAKGELKIQDGDRIIKQLYTDSISMEPKTTATLITSLDTKNIPSGDYQAIAILDYDGLKTADQENFRLGDLYINLTNYTREFEFNKINRWDIFIESRWNKQIKALHAEVKIIQEGKEIDIDAKTPSINLEPWQTTRLNAFWDTSGFAIGEYEAKLIFYYEGRVQENPIKIMIIKPSIIKQFPLLINKIGLKTIILLIILLVVILDLIWLLMSRKKKQNEK